MGFFAAKFSALALFVAAFSCLSDRAEGALLSMAEARQRLELLGLPLGVDAFARAVATNHRPLIELCFSSQLDVNGRGAGGRTPLVLTAMQADWELANRLLANDADPTIADEQGVTPLMIAAMHGNVNFLKALLARGVDAASVDTRGCTALHYAVAAGKLSAVELLLPLTPRLDAPCADGRDLLTMAFEAERPAIANLVLERVPPTLKWSSHTRQALARALLTANRDQIRLLLSKHPAPPTPEGRSSPLLAYAVATNDATLFNLLLSCGADPNTTLPSPCEKEFVPLVAGNYLRHYVEEDSGVTVLMLAAGLGRTEFVRALIEHGAERNRVTPKHRMIALYFACHSPSWECTKLLFGSGPSPEELRIEVSLSLQQATIYKQGVPIFSTEISSGRSGFSTPTGRYIVTDKDRNHRSTIYKVPMPFFMRLSCRDFGLHEGAVPNYPASHGCIRLPTTAARKLFAEIPLGTLVNID